MPNLEKHVRVSRKIDLSDIDWELAARIGLTDDEVTVLTYFGDIEGQTVYYLREMLNTKPARDPETLAFLTLWNYEEYFHSYALAKLLRVCGHDLGGDRQRDVRKSAQFAAKAEEVVQTLISKIFPQTFVSLWMAWGASQELLTLRGYEQIAVTTRNPVLAQLCRRIAKQERRHFAYYFNAAKERLEGERFQQKFVRTVFEKFWTPVGGGVKSESEIEDCVAGLFPGEQLHEVMARIDERLSQIPGLHGFRVATDYADKIAARGPALVASPASRQLAVAGVEYAERELEIAA